uniref:Dynein heavy chain C-terminal domain-containing protein n=1 Tax=Anopheles farauti TaxID=69004 RepID=A0A182QNU8_9DIPT
MENPCHGWLPDAQWDELTDLDRMPGFHGIVESFAELPDDWKRWYLSSVPEAAPLPGSWEANLKMFQKHLIVRSLRMDRIEHCMADFTRATLGAKFLNLPASSLEDVYQESSANTLILVLVRGNVSPLGKVERLARKVCKDEKEKRYFEKMTMGENRIEEFITLLQRCIADECWLFVGDCHVSETFLKQLPQVVAFLKGVNLNSKFRLWLGSKPHAALPVSVLQNCIKLAYEEAKGIRHHMENLYGEIGETRFRKSAGALKQGSTGAAFIEPSYKRLLFTMAFLHALLLERTNFQQLGWITPYHFVHNDFSLAERLLSYGLEKLLVKKAHETTAQRGKGGRANVKSSDVCLDDGFHGLIMAEDEQRHDPTPWEFIKGGALELCYGAQIASPWDRRVYSAYVKELFQPQLLTATTYAVSSSPPSIRRGWFRLPRDGTYQTYVEFIATQLPARDGMDVFGQHENANIKYLKSRSGYMMQMLTRVLKDPSYRQLQPHYPGQDHERTKQTILDLLSTLPVYLDYENALRIVGAGANRTPVCDALLAEVRTYNAMLKRIRTDGDCLLRMLTGATNELLDEAGRGKWSMLQSDLQQNTVPTGWTQLGVEARVPLSDWMLQLRERVRYFRRWTEVGQLPAEIVLGRFTDPKRFLNAVLQLHANTYRVPFEEMRWDFRVFATAKPLERISIQDGFIARGLTLENGSWDWEKQTLAVPEILELTCPMPPIAFRPVQRRSFVAERSKSTSYQCPVFYSPRRSEDSLVLVVPLPIGEEQDEEAWCLFNTALFLNDQ